MKNEHENLITSYTMNTSAHYVLTKSPESPMKYISYPRYLHIPRYI